MQLQDLCPHVLGSSKVTEILMGVMNDFCNVSAITCSLWLEMISFNQNAGYGASTYNSYGGFGGAYSNGGGLYGNNMHSGYGGGYGGSYGGSGMYGGSMYNNGMGNPYGGMGM